MLRVVIRDRKDQKEIPVKLDLREYKDLKEI
jgi:hypothetical protein